MRFESKQFFLGALTANGLDENIDAYTEEGARAGNILFPAPEAHSHVLPFARRLLKMASPNSGLLIMPSEWGVWPSSENWHLYHFVRTSCGGNQSLQERPCHVFGVEETDLALDYIYLFLLFSWDFYVFAFHEDDLLFVSHDGFGVYHASSRAEEVRSEIDAMFAVNDDVESRDIH